MSYRKYDSSMSQRYLKYRKFDLKIFLKSGPTTVNLNHKVSGISAFNPYTARVLSKCGEGYD